MKISHSSLALLSVLAFSPDLSSALSCGIKGVTENCIGDTDVRYNTDVSYDLVSQDEFWSKISGFVVGEECTYDINGQPRVKVYLGGTENANLGTYDFCNIKTFVNNKIVGSRYYSHRYALVQHNGDAPGNTKLPGLVIPSDSYFVSTFEKNGAAQLLGSSTFVFGANFTVSDVKSTITPIDGKVAIGVVIGSMQSTSCLDEDCNVQSVSTELYTDDTETGSKIIESTARGLYTKVDKAEWLSEMDETFKDYNIPSVDMAFPGFEQPTFTRPFEPSDTDIAPECTTLICPTEDDWKERDPKLGVSPFKEPDGVLTGGFIAIITILSILVAMTIFYFVYKQGMAKRERRVKEAVMKSIAKSMGISVSKEMNPTELNDTFNKIDEDGNGNLSKEEVKGLVEQAGVANMSDSDYNTLFSSIDLDGNGTLDFAEFCAFFTSIPTNSEVFAES